MRTSHQRDKVTFPKPHSSHVVRPGYKSRPHVSPKLMFLNIMVHCLSLGCLRVFELRWKVVMEVESNMVSELDLTEKTSSNIIGGFIGALREETTMDREGIEVRNGKQ